MNRLDAEWRRLLQAKDKRIEQLLDEILELKENIEELEMEFKVQDEQ